MKQAASPSRTRKAQVTTIDFVTGLVIITTAIIIVTSLIQGLREPSSFERVKREALMASDALMGEGYPQDWNQTTAVRIGLLSEGALNKTKLEAADNLSYDDLRAALNGADDIYWYFTNKTDIINLSSCGYGDPAVSTGPDCEPALPAADNLVRIERFVTHENRILRMVVLAWD